MLSMLAHLGILECLATGVYIKNSWVHLIVFCVSSSSI